MIHPRMHTSQFDRLSGWKLEMSRRAVVYTCTARSHFVERKCCHAEKPGKAGQEGIQRHMHERNAR